MKKYKVPTVFDGGKFASRYGLSAHRGEYFIDNEGMLNVPDGLRDDPPLFELPDPPASSIQEQLDSVTTLADLIQVLKQRL